MKYKYGLIFICLIIFLFSIVTVCASDTNETVVANDDLNEIVVEKQKIDNIGANEKNELSASEGSFTDLSNDIAKAGNELNLTRNYSFSSSDSSYKKGIFINKEITINGNGFFINGNNMARIFNITNNNVVLNNINFVNFFSSGYKYNSGGAVCWYGVNGSMINCCFINCSTYSSGSGSNLGGAVYWSGVNGSMVGCSFLNCSSSTFNNDLNMAHSYGGAIFLEGNNSSIVNCSFINCSSYCTDDSGGGAVYLGGVNGSVVGCSFVNCYTESDGGYGGAVYLSGDKSVSNCSFVNCFSSGYSSGGAVYWSGVNGSLVDCSFVNCSNSKSNYISCLGSAVYILYWVNGSVVNCSFVNCSSNGSDSEHVVYVGGYGSVVNCSFVNCYRGAIKCYGSVVGCSFVNCFRSFSYSGTVYLGGVNGSVVGCSFVNCSSSSYESGGAVYLGGVNGSVVGCNFVNCFSSGSSSGGAIYCYGAYGAYGSYGSVVNCSFVNCSSSSYESGGAVYWSGVNGSMVNCSFVNCSSSCSGSISSSGGAIYWEGNYGSVVGCSFVNCFSPGIGGAVYWSGVNGSVVGCSFVNWSSLGYESSGAVSWSGVNGSMVNCSFVNCSGRAIYWRGVNGSVVNCSFVNCSSSGSSSGGAINWEGNYGSVVGCSFVNCSSAVYWSYYNGLYGSVVNCSFVNCSGRAVYWEGVNGSVVGCSFVNCSDRAIYWSYYNGLYGSVVNCSFVNCSSSGYGGAVYWSGNYGSVVGCSFVNCSGAVYWSDYKGLYGSVVNCSFVNCSTSGYGGAVHWSGNYGSVVGCSFVNCSGAVYWSGVNGSMVNCSFVNCSSLSYGGAVYWSGNYGSVVGCSFVNCSSSGYESGGAVYWSGNYGSVVGCSFVNCSISGYGGAVYWSGNYGSVVNCSFINNTASRGKSIYWKGSKGYIYKNNFDNDSFKYEEQIYTKNKFNIDLTMDVFIDNDVEFFINITPYARLNANLYLYKLFDNNKILIEQFNLNLNQYFTNLSYSNLSEGNYSLECYYLGDTVYNSKSCSLYFSQLNYTSSLTIDIPKKIYDVDDFYINLTFDEHNITGDISIIIDNVKYSEKMINSSASFKMPKISGGIRNITIVYKNSNNSFIFIKKEINIPFIESHIILSWNIYENNSVRLVSINPMLNSGATGNITIYVDNIYKAQIAVGENYTLSGLIPGSYSLKFVYSGDNFYKNCENTTIITVNKLNTTILTIPIKVIAGDTVLSIILNNNVTGTVMVNINNKNYSKTISNGNATIYIYDLPRGVYDYTVYYSGDQNFNSKDITDSLTIQPKKATININAYDCYVNEQVNVNYVLNSGASGKLSIYANDDFIKNVSVGSNINLGYLKWGNYTIKVIYMGDGYYATCEDTVNIKVKKCSSNFNISIGDFYIDDDIYMGYNIEDDATGTISVYIDNSLVKTVAVGRYIDLPSLKAGKYTLKAVYSGNDYYEGSVCSALFEVKKIEPFYYFNDIAGRNVPFDFIISGGDATGFVNLKINEYYYPNCKVINGKTTVVIPILNTGSNNFTINYSGDDKYESIDDSGVFYVDYRESPITMNIPELNWGDLFVINPILPVGATGDIELLIDNVSLCNMSVGKSYRYNALIGGKHYLTVRYGGDDFFDENETIFEFTVNRFDSSIVVNDTYWANPSILLVFQLDQETTGFIKLTINNKQYSGEVRNGTCKINVNNLNIGSNNIVINYTGDNKYNPIYTVKEVNVLLKDPKLNLTINNIITGNNIVIRPTVISGATGSFKIYVDNTLKSTINVGSSYTLSKPAIGKHEIKIIYSGDSYFKSNNFTTTFRVFTVYPIESSDMQIIYGSNKYFKAKFYDEYGNPLSNKYVQFNVNGTDYPVKTNDDGIAVLNINLDVGTYNVTSISILDESKSNKLFIFHSVQAENMVIEYDGSYRFKASFLDENAEPLSKTGVIFILDGVTQPMVTTDVNGIAVLDKTLSLGSHTVTSINTITNENITNYIFVVSDINSIINIHELNDVNYGQNIELSIDVGENYLDAVIEIKITGDNGYNQIFSQKATSKITKQLNGLNAGKYTVDVKYQDNNNLFNLELNKTFSVFKINPIMNIGISDVYVGGYATINVDVSNSNGLVSIKVGSRKYNEQLTNGKLVKVINGLAIGEYDVEIIFEGDNNYNPMIKTGSFKMYHTWNFNTNFGSVIVLEDKETYDEDIWGYTNYEVKIYNIIGDENDIIELFIDGNPVEILEKGYDTDDVGNEYWWIEFSPAFLSEGNHNWEIKYSNIPSFVVGTESGSFNAISWRVYGGNNFENKITKSITYVLNKDVNWKVKKVHYKDGMDIYLSTFTLNGKSFFIFTGLDVLTDSNMPIFEVFDSSEYFLYDGSYYKVNNGRIIDVIDVHDHITIEGVNYKFIGRFTNYENSYEVLNGKCYRYDGFYHEAIKDVDYKIINGKYYTMDNEEIEEYNSNQWNIIDGTKYYIEDNYYNAITPTTLGSDLALINGNYYSVVHKNLNIDIEDNKDNYYAIIDGNLYPVVKGVIGSPINLKQAINPTDIVISLLTDGTGDIKLPNDASGTITLSIAGKNYNFNVVNGIANVNMPDLTNGEYPYTITYSGDEKYASFSETGSITINKPVPHVDPAPTTLILKNIKVKRSAKKLALQATLKEGNSPIIGKKIIFKFNGVKYKAKTNAKGIAKLTIKSKVLKKLKVGKKVKYQASYGKLVVKKSAKVKK